MPQKRHGKAERKRGKNNQGRWQGRCHLSWASKNTVGPLGSKPRWPGRKESRPFSHPHRLKWRALTWRTEGGLSGKDILGRTLSWPHSVMWWKARGWETGERWPGDKGKAKASDWGVFITERCLKTHPYRNKMCHIRLLVKGSSRLLWPSSSRQKHDQPWGLQLVCFLESASWQLTTPPPPPRPQTLRLPRCRRNLEKHPPTPLPWEKRALKYQGMQKVKSEAWRE